MTTRATPAHTSPAVQITDTKREDRRAEAAFDATLAFASMQALPQTKAPSLGDERSKPRENAAFLGERTRARTELEQSATVDVSRLAAAELRGEGDSRHALAESPAPVDSTIPGRTRAPAKEPPRQAVAPPQPERAQVVKAEPGSEARVSADAPGVERSMRGVRAQAAAPVAAVSAARIASPGAKMIEGLTASGAGAASRAGPGGTPVTARGVTGVPVAQRAGAKVSAQPPKAAGSPRTDRQIHAQAVRGIAAAVKQGGGSITLRLEPEHLGSLRVRVEVKGHKVTAGIEAGTESARRLLEEGRESLRAALEARGLQVERVEVRLNEHLSDGVRDDADWEGSHGGGGEDAAGSWTSRDGEDRRGGTTRRDHQEGRREASQPAVEPRPAPHHAALVYPEGALGGLNAIA